MADGAALYDEDFVRWSEEQAGAIRAAAACGTNLPLDWENLAEEIESLGKSQRAELANRLDTIVEHLLKLECSPAAEPRGGWRGTISRTRGRVERLLTDSPSLRRLVPALLREVQPVAARSAREDLAGFGESDFAIDRRMDLRGYTAEQVLGDWFPGGDS